MLDHFRFSVRNIWKYGDTDIFPLPIENHIFYDNEDEIVALLEDIHNDFENKLAQHPPYFEGALTSVGYYGFRWGTQIDPFWNAYLLALVISIGEKIEQARISSEKLTIFSYRFCPDENEYTLFDKEMGWRQFQETSVELAGEYETILICDIADFYPRIYHHRLDNALKKLNADGTVVKWIMQLLMHFSKNNSYGLPVGGPAARLLSELLLNRVDRLLNSKGIRFCRFADDYHVFARNKEEAHDFLVFLSEKLIENEGLLLQKAKTRIVSAKEFLATSTFSEENKPESGRDSEIRSFLALSLYYDPYSDSADDDYEKLKEEINRFDIVGMLGREIAKSRIDQALTRKLIKSVKHLAPSVQSEAIKSLMANLPVLYPVLPSVLLLLKSILEDLDENTRTWIFCELRQKVREDSYLIQVQINLAYLVRILAYDVSEEADEVLIKIYDSSSSALIRREVILAMAKRNADYWISDVLKGFRGCRDWEKRSLIISSYILGDEGKHWRGKIKKELSPFDSIVVNWASKKKQSSKWSIPI